MNEKYRYSHCFKCGSHLALNYVFQSYFCPKCKEWLNPKCEKEDCEYCKNRPDVPEFS